MIENMIGKKVFLTDDCGDGEMLMCSDTVTAILIEENSMSVRCKTSGDEFWTVGKNAFFSESEAKQALLDIATEEKTHVGEFESLLKKLDKNFDNELKSGEEEIESMKEARERIYGKKATKQLNEMKNIFNKLIK